MIADRLTGMNLTAPRWPIDVITMPSTQAANTAGATRMRQDLPSSNRIAASSTADSAKRTKVSDTGVVPVS